MDEPSKSFLLLIFAEQKEALFKKTTIVRETNEEVQNYKNEYASGDNYEVVNVQTADEVNGIFRDTMN